jgi:predicted MFS family arabinose efflux permease
VRKQTARLILKWSYVVSGLLLAVSLADAFLWRGRYVVVTYMATGLLVLLLSLLLLTPNREAHRLVPVPERRETRVVVRWRTHP